MVWIPGTDYPRAQHVGYPVSVLADGTETGATPLPADEAVTGWRARCDCAWRGRQFYPRAEWLSATGAVPAAVEDWDTATCDKWVRHVQDAVPGLSIYGLARQLTDFRATLNEAVAVAVARRAGLSWAQIGDAAGSAPSTRPDAGGGAGLEAVIRR